MKTIEALGVQDAWIYPYLAGIIDGEGCFCISKKTDRHYSPLIAVGMVDQVIINKLKETFGGNVYTEEGKYRPIYKWQVRNFDSVVAVINKLSPYLIVKTEAAALLMEFITGRELTDVRVMTDDEVQRRQAIYIKIKKANAVGAAFNPKER